MKQILILGSTGSIGQQTVDVIKKLHASAVGLSAYRDVDRMEEQIRELHPLVAVLTDPDAARDLKARVQDTKTRVLAGTEGLTEMIRQTPCDGAVNGISGMAGTRPFLELLRRGIPVAVANKESLVTAGPLLQKEAKHTGAAILPVDSEHSAIFQCMQGAHSISQVKRLLLTASGGPFFGWKKEELNRVTPSMALNHPSWRMGAKITVDCATMMNKGLEIMEAVRLFGLPQDKIQVLIHRESIVHSMIEFQDHAVLAQLGTPDMRVAIQYALTYPNRFPSPAEELDLTKVASLSFAPLDTETFPATEICRQAIAEDGLCPTVLNAANEVAVEAFLEGRLSFPGIIAIVQEQLDRASRKTNPDLEEIFACDRETRVLAQERINHLARP